MKWFILALTLKYKATMVNLEKNLECIVKHNSMSAHFSSYF